MTTPQLSTALRSKYRKYTFWNILIYGQKSTNEVPWLQNIKSMVLLMSGLRILESKTPEPETETKVGVIGPVVLG